MEGRFRPKNGVSILICCYNSEKRLVSLFENLEKLDCLGVFFELIIVDNGSVDQTYHRSIELFKNLGWNGRVIKEDMPGLSFARRAGVKAASFEFVLFCDDDNFLEPDYIKQGLIFFERYLDLGGLGGYGSAPIFGQVPFWFEKLSGSYALGSLGKLEGIQPLGSVHYGAGLFFRKEALERFYDRSISSPITDRKGSSLASGGDSELCLAIQLEGYRLAYSEKLKFTHAIEIERITEEYYLKLRSGILANFPILESYVMILKGETSDFNKKYFSRLISMVFGLFKSFGKFLLKRDFVRKVQFLNYWWKLKGLVFNYGASHRLFKELKLNYLE